MELQVLSHAGLSVRHADRQLLCDPWVLGSTYWRSWWNYPPVPKDVVESLEPTHVYLTHVHWDHFQGASLKRFPRDTTILVPSGPYDRMRRDLNSIGFHDVVELGHRESYDLAPDFRITSYHFGLFLDSAVVIEADGVTILNANDAKIMGRPLRDLLDRHPPIDFVLRSHSSANSRLSYEVVDQPGAVLDDPSRYTESFAKFAIRTGATYAIPFASNHCFLHKDVFDLNHTVTTPLDVKQHFEDEGISSPVLRVMTPGDSWSTDGGFSGPERLDLFENRDDLLREYATEMAPKLEEFYATEDRSTIRLKHVQRYFEKFSSAIPWVVRRRFRGHPITWVLRSGADEHVFEVHLDSGSVRQLEDYDDERNPIQVHTSTLVMVRCMARDLFSHLAISKRVRYRSTVEDKRYIQMMNTLFNLYEYDMLPLRRILSRRSLRNWAARRDELLLYARISFDLLRRKGLDPARYI